MSEATNLPKPWRVIQEQNGPEVAVYTAEQMLAARNDMSGRPLGRVAYEADMAQAVAKAVAAECAQMCDDAAGAGGEWDSALIYGAAAIRERFGIEGSTKGRA